MGITVFIAEKPSVATEFAKALKLKTRKRDGYIESENVIITWCVGHLVTMSYPEKYDEKYKKWSLSTLPFLPDPFIYEVIPNVKKQFDIVTSILNRKDVDTIYVCTDSGREGEYIYRLVEQKADVSGKTRKRVWIDSQTEDEILRGIKEAKDLSEYDNLASAAYLRAKEDYLMGINFSRLLTLKYGRTLSSILKTNYTVISVGRVMTCVLGMVVKREREIRSFIKTPFYRIMSTIPYEDIQIEAEWKAVEGSKYYQSPVLYKENGFREKENALALIDMLANPQPCEAEVVKKENKTEKKQAPLLYNLAELQNDCSKMFKISPDETLKVVQELYEKKMVTYPRTDARVLSTAISKEIYKNIKGLCNIGAISQYANTILESGSYKNIAKTKYVNDKQITDHYAIIPTGQGLGALRSLSPLSGKVYEVIVRRFLSIFYPPAVYKKISLVFQIKSEQFFTSYKVLEKEGYLEVMGKPSKKNDKENAEQNSKISVEILNKISRRDKMSQILLTIKEGETTPPKRYNSGTIILAMENAGQLIEDEELRAQIKGSGIGTSATRAEILKKLVNNKYLQLNKKTQIITPAQLGELIFDTVSISIQSLLNPELTASWEKGLSYVAEGSITSEEYMDKLEQFIIRRTNAVLQVNNQSILFSQAAHYIKGGK